MHVNRQLTAVIWIRNIKHFCIFQFKLSKHKQPLCVAKYSFERFSIMKTTLFWQITSCLMSLVMECMLAFNPYIKRKKVINIYKTWWNEIITYLSHCQMQSHATLLHYIQYPWFWYSNKRIRFILIHIMLQILSF